MDGLSVTEYDGIEGVYIFNSLNAHFF